MTTTLQILSFLSFALGVFFYGIKELQSHGKLKWAKETIGGDLPTFWAKDSDMRKYKIDKSNPRAYSFAVAPNNWYYRFFKIKYKEKFPLSATLLVSLTDGYHLTQLLFKLLFCISIVTYSMEFNWWMVLTYFVIWSVVFTVTYKWLSK